MHTLPSPSQLRVGFRATDLPEEYPILTCGLAYEARTVRTTLQYICRERAATSDEFCHAWLAYHKVFGGGRTATEAYQNLVWMIESGFVEVVALPDALVPGAQTLPDNLWQDPN